MRALFILRPDIDRIFGGDLVQAQKTAAALHSFGVDADITGDVQPILTGYDLAHVFGISQPVPCERQIRACKSAGVPVVVSPIWWSSRELSALAIPADDPATVGRLKAAPGGFNVALSEIAGVTVWLATVPLPDGSPCPSGRTSMFSAAMSALVAVLLAVVMREADHVRPADLRVVSLLRGALVEIASRPLVWRLFLATAITQIGLWTILPYAPIYIARLAPGDKVTAVGVVLSGVGFGQAIASPLWGVVMQKFGHVSVLSLTSVGASLALATVGISHNIVLFAAGLIGLAWLLPQPRAVDGVTFDIHTLYYCSLAVVVGFQSIGFWFFARVHGEREGIVPPDPWFRWLLQLVPLEAGLLAAAALLLLGFGLGAYALGSWGAARFGPLDPTETMRLIIPSGTAILPAFHIAYGAFFLSVLDIRSGRKKI